MTAAAGAGRPPVSAGPAICIDFTNRRHVLSAAEALERQGYDRTAGALRRVVGNPGAESAIVALVESLRELPGTTLDAAGLTVAAHGAIPSRERGR